MSTITREEIKTYNRIRSKLLTHDQSTQTDIESENQLSSNNQYETPIILMQLPIDFSKYYDDRDDDDEYEDDDEEDDDDGDEESKLDKLLQEQDKLFSNEQSSKDSECDSECENIELKKKPNKRKIKNCTSYVREEKKYYKELPNKKQKVIDEIEKQIQDINYVKTPMRFKILESNMDIRLKALAINKVEQLNSIDSSSSEYMKLYNWIENISKLPIGKYKQLPIDYNNSIDDITAFLDNIKKNIDSKVFGHNDAKNQVIRLLAKWISNPDSKGLVIGIEGEMGTGKTSLCNAVCESLNLPFGFVQLGGISDGSYLVGHSYTYEGSRHGRIAEILMKVGCMNPVLYFDELDKISTTRHGEEIVNILIHLTDSSQNDKFHDKYFSDIEFDLSKCLIVFSYNHGELINPILKDRMITVKTEGYSQKEKLKIAKEYMMPLIIKEFSFNAGDIILSDEVYNYIISITDEEKGVRNLKRSLEELISQVNLHKLLKKNIIEKEELQFPVNITRDIIDKFIHKKERNLSLPMMYI